MRTVEGLPLAEASLWEAELRRIEKEGLVHRSEDRWLLTPRGRLLADTVAEIFV
jgi:coproporphyrinogen III oxidase-like Fe-S oxidoreductase